MLSVYRLEFANRIDIKVLGDERRWGHFCSMFLLRITDVLRGLILVGVVKVSIGHLGVHIVPAEMDEE